MEKAYKNLGYLLLLLIPLTLVGFFKTYFNQFPIFKDNITIFIHLHAFIALVWIVMLIVQPLLIRNRKNDWHKKLGRLSYFFFPLLILSFVPQMIRLIHSDHAIALFFPLSDSILLILFYSLAIYYRKEAPKHMRYMIGTAIVFLSPTLGRIGPHFLEWSDSLTQNILYGVIYMILIGLILLDRKSGKNYNPYLLIFGTWVIHQITFNLLF